LTYAGIAVLAPRAKLNVATLPANPDHDVAPAVTGTTTEGVVARSSAFAPVLDRSVDPRVQPILIMITSFAEALVQAHWPIPEDE
jgi:hypothetical protein